MLRNPKGNANPFFVCSLLERFDCAVGGMHGDSLLRRRHILENITALAAPSVLQYPAENADPFVAHDFRMKLHQQRVLALERFDHAVGGVRDNPPPLTGLIDRLMMIGIAALRASPENARQRARFLHKNRVPPIAVAGMPKNRIERIG